MPTTAEVIEGAVTLVEKPPLGLTPESLHRRQRALDIIAAIDRYVCADIPIPKEWLAELDKLYGAA